MAPTWERSGSCHGALIGFRKKEDLSASLVVSLNGRVEP